MMMVLINNIYLGIECLIVTISLHTKHYQSQAMRLSAKYFPLVYTDALGKNPPSGHLVNDLASAISV